MTTPSPEFSCRWLTSLWPEPAAFAAVGPDGACAAGDAALAGRAAELLAGAPPGAVLVRAGGLVVARPGPERVAFAADVPGAALPALLEADLAAVSSERP